MTRAPSYRSSYHDPYDELDELPTYPDEQAAFPPRPKSLNGEAKKDGLMAGGPMTVDQFAYEIGRLRNEVEKLPASTARIADLRAQALALDPADNSLVAQSLLADLAVQTSAVFDVLPSHIAETRSFASKVAVLKPAAGRFLVTAGETAELKAELARCALSLDSAIQQISDGAKAEEKNKQEARVRLLKVIKAKLGDRGTDAEQMSLLLTAEREGTAARPEKLKPGSFGWRWSVEHPFTRLEQAVKNSGDLSFLSALKAAPTPAPSLWANPLSYIPSLTSTSKQPTGYVPPSATDTSLTAAEEGSYGSPLNPPPAKPSSKWIKWVFLLLVLVSIGAAAGVIVYLGKRVDEHANGGEEAEAAAATPTVILGAPGHAIPLRL
ncbi:hypothetical protein RTBOTA2_000316 [Rhodotorula toruloides]|uniref:Uncharacterized protein n=1 Tax=Rhodotorula toruloides TaxID=5286 RepID=A0A2T0AFZ7_RHOTO|nr:hypothetical protein RTBOTA2_000316 [Rhodotorula toruloides]PRQ76928.1 hypothetical protein AAT19DRAFT_12346 [Rhodotorula toruloides]